MKIIDTHTHLKDGMFRAGSVPGLTRKEFLQAMEENNVERCWITNVSSCYGIGEYEECNRSLYSFCKEFEKRFTGFLAVNPSYGTKTLDEIRRCVEDYGFKGLKLHPWCQGFSVTSGIMNDITEECIKYDVPILFHDGTPPYSTTLAIANIAERYPEAKIILGHSGLTEMYDNAISAANKYRNIYLCLCGPSIFQLQKIVDSVSSDRIMFGSDTGLGTDFLDQNYRLDAFKYVNMSEEVKEKLFFRNAETLIPSQMS